MLEEVWNQAKWHHSSARINTAKSESRIYKGIKIENEEGTIKIYNTKVNGDFYREVSKEQYQFFIDNGYLKGVHNVCLFNYERSLDLLQDKIRDELGNRNNQKHYQSLKVMRENLMNKYTKIIYETRQQLQHQVG